MKKVFSILIVLAAFTFTLNSQELPGTAASKSIIYFYRIPNYVGSGTKMTIMIDDQPAGRLGSGRFFRIEVAPGDHTFSFNFGSDSRLRIKTEPGTSYYLKCYLNVGAWAGIPVMELVDPASGRAMIGSNAMAEQAAVPVVIKPLRSRLGVIFSAGAGFDRYPWFTDEDGEDVNLSWGGGFGIGAEYSHLLGRSADIAIDAFYQGSTLSQALKNGSGIFSRMVISVTPSLRIPYRGGSILNFKLGAGPGIYALGSLKVDASDAVGSLYILKYKTTAGFHIDFSVESNFSEKGSMDLGLRYYNLKYKFTEEGSSHTINDMDLENPSGSGIDFYMIYSFRF